MSFFKSWAFWFLAGIFIGCIIGYFVAALCFISARASRHEDKIEQSLMRKDYLKEKNATNL